jgi:Nitronate monooxygenase
LIESTRDSPAITLADEAVRSLIKAVKNRDRRSAQRQLHYLSCQSGSDPNLHRGRCVRGVLSLGSSATGVRRALHEAGIKVWEQVGSVTTAKEAVDSGIDLIIAEGSEAGGHNYGSLPTFVLVPSILAAVAPHAGVGSRWRHYGPPTGGCARSGPTRYQLVRDLWRARKPLRTQNTNDVWSNLHVLKRVCRPPMVPMCRTFNPMRVLDVGLGHDFADCEEKVPKDLKSQPIIASMKLAGETISLHRFTSFVLTPDTAREFKSN